MPTVTGTLRDFNIQSLAAYSPRLIFTPSSTAVSTSRLYSTKPIIVTPNLGGDFEVFLVASDSVFPMVSYSIRVEWLDAENGYVGADVIDWELLVPEAGGAIGDIMQVPANPILAWVDVVEPPFKPVPGVWWLQVNPDDPDDPRATGILWEA